MPFDPHIHHSLTAINGYYNVNRAAPERIDIFSGPNRLIWTRACCIIGLLKDLSRRIIE